MMLEVENLKVRFKTRDGEQAVLHGIDLSLARGETLGIVGESGSGKSMLALATIGLLPRGASATGEIRLSDENLLRLSERQLSAIRGARIGMIFQEPMTALNPAMTVGSQIAEALRLHRRIARGVARQEAMRLLEMVQIARASARINAYPHELSGGERQRVGIAIALALKPELLIADEPTTALDVTVQAEILDILDELVRELGIGLLLISHDFGVIARMADRVAVMHDGRVMETGSAEDVIRRPSHSYTKRLLSSLPRRVRAGLGDGS
ncbi:ATP-binding cassette domain-containing protein [Martelella radicis]|uniref:Peptide/nickel transport system ATP-binding protein n=1 Tax=Martelella radicis TaxID=1397476 RepID=A0A7W6KJ93_9HYPH|nr:ABC transporter ATP-binding protein [Martelella radicis]MBB4122025.1 peptide/nickel transport system ATP-binding protein [Martelella radicis]